MHFLALSSLLYSPGLQGWQRPSWLALINVPGMHISVGTCVGIALGAGLGASLGAGIGTLLGAGLGSGERQSPHPEQEQEYMLAKFSHESPSTGSL